MSMIDYTNTDFVFNKCGIDKYLEHIPNGNIK